MISIIVPIYNVETVLNRCLVSISEQTFKDFECILVDDGSTDSSAFIAKLFTTSDIRFRYYSQKNAGQGSARNYGIRQSRGEYLCFVDSDDYIHPQYLELLFNALVTNRADFASCAVERVYDDGRHVNYSLTNQYGATIITNIKDYLVSASFAVWNKIFKRCLFDNLSFPENMKFEDFALMPQVYERAQRIVSISDVLYYYYWRENSTTTTKKIKFDILKAQGILENSPFANRNPEIIKIYFVRQVMGSLLWEMSYKSGFQFQIKQIISDAKQKYGNISDYILDCYIGAGKSIWGKLLWQEKYNSARCYALMYESIRSVGRKLLTRLRRSK